MSAAFNPGASSAPAGTSKFAPSKATNDAVAQAHVQFTRQVDQFPPQAVLDEIRQKVDIQKLEQVLMEEGVKKFADPQKDLLGLIARKRRELSTA